MSQNINTTYGNFFLKSRLRHLYRSRSVIINNSCQPISNFNILYLLLDMSSHAMTWQSKTIHQKMFKTKNPTHSFSLKFHPFFLWTPAAQVNCHFSRVIFFYFKLQILWQQVLPVLFHGPILFCMTSFSSAYKEQNKWHGKQRGSFGASYFRPEEKPSNYLCDTDWKKWKLGLAKPCEYT